MNIDAGYFISIAVLLLICITGSCIHRVPRFGRLTWRSGGRRRVYGTGLAIVQLPVLLAFIVVNVGWLCAGGRPELMSRSAMLTKINLALLFMAGRSNPVIGILGIQSSVIRLLQVWVGLIALCQGLIHAGLALNQAQMQMQTTSGCILIFILCLAFVSSLVYLRRQRLHVVLLVHLFFAVATLSVTLWHMRISGCSLLSPLIAVVLWAMSLGFRLYRIIYWSKEARCEISSDGIEVAIPRSLKTRPGQYFYMYFPDLPLLQRFRSYKLVVLDCETGNDTVAKLELVVEDAKKIFESPTKTRILLDGPWGADIGLQIEKCDRIALLGEGIGMAGLLPAAFYIYNETPYLARPKQTQMRSHKSVDLYWRPGGVEKTQFVKRVSSELNKLENVDCIVGAICDLTDDTFVMPDPPTTPETWQQEEKNLKKKKAEEEKLQKMKAEEEELKKKETQSLLFWTGHDKRRQNLATLIFSNKFSEYRLDEERLIVVCGTTKFMEEVYSICEEGPDPYKTRFIELELESADDLFFISKVPKKIETSKVDNYPEVPTSLRSSSIYPPSNRYSSLNSPIPS